MLIASFGPAEISKFPLLFANSENMKQFASGFMHPDFSGWRDLIGKMWLTIQMALWGTSLAIVLAVPMGLLGARNVAPPFIQLPVRRAMDLIRSVPDLVIGTAFLVAVGLGPFAGGQIARKNGGYRAMGQGLATAPDFHAVRWCQVVAGPQAPFQGDANLDKYLLPLERNGFELAQHRLGWHIAL